ncbi:hypothetical protein HYH03_010737 [Edaphochlamys debaryana]|uniref:Uncharacterized protein n=1 Tax=Edaphochlamys debaryana TaxID=47281 RepID=A0A835XVY7_9CHLO|nr:hypothetical protein HYH03_010737 [Edaphochlamys debaryana]|eukprot:KAG2490815.1 hypothetical protein HYH03_010737 [Edaphochlamys debaryana]
MRSPFSLYAGLLVQASPARPAAAGSEPSEARRAAAAAPSDPFGYLVAAQEAAAGAAAEGGAKTVAGAAAAADEGRPPAAIAPGPAVLCTDTEIVFGSEGAGGALLRLEPGEVPAALTPGHDRPRANAPGYRAGAMVGGGGGDEQEGEQEEEALREEEGEQAEEEAEELDVLITGYASPLPPHTPAVEPAPQLFGGGCLLTSRFLSRVFALSAASLAAASAAGVAALAAPPAVSRAVLSKPWLLPLACVLSLGTLLLLALSEEVRRPHPSCWQAYLAFTAGLALMAAIATACLHTPLLALGFGLAAAGTAAVSAAAAATGAGAREEAFNFGGGALDALAGVAVAFGACALAVPALTGARTAGGVAAAAAAAAFGIYEVADVVAVLNGRHAYGVRLDEHVFQALAIYVDPICLLLLGLHKCGVALAAGGGRGQRAAGAAGGRGAGLGQGLLIC